MTLPAPADMGSAIVIARVIDGSIVPIFVALFLGTLTWGSWTTWQTRRNGQRIDDLIAMHNATQVLQLETKAALDSHRLDDAKEFATMHERSAGFERIIDKIMGKSEFWSRAGQDRASLT